MRRVCVGFLTIWFLAVYWGPASVLNTFAQASIAPPRSRGVNWERGRHKIETREWARGIVENLRQQVEVIKKRYEHPPIGRTGWYHDYYCEKDGHRLEFNPNTPHKHLCPVDGTVYSGSPYDDVWRSTVHRQIIDAVQTAAVLYRLTQEDSYLEYARSMLVWYAGNLEEFQVHGQHAGQGRIMSQSLDEATQMVRLITAYWDLAPALSPEIRRKLADQLFLPEARFIHKQTGIIHNIHSWHNAAVGLIGLAFGEKALVQEAIDGPYGLKQQIQQGVKADGFWYEGSISYHFYTIRSLLPLFLAAQSQGYDLSGTKKFKRMFTAPIHFTFSNGEFPANNDGWPAQTIYEQSTLYEAAAHLWDDFQFASLLSTIYDQQPRNSVNALLYGRASLPAGQPIQRESILFEDSGVAFLRQPGVEAYLKFGPYGGGHDHHDRLNLIVYGLGKVLIPDLGTSGYGIDLNAWYRSAAAHNLLVVDGQRQAATGGELVSFKKDSVHAEVNNAYEDVQIQRRLTQMPSGYRDQVWAVSTQEHQYDLFYHVRGRLDSSSTTLREREEFQTGDGYKWLNRLRQSDTQITQTRLLFDLRDTAGQLILECSSSTPFHVVTGVAPDLPGDQHMQVVLLRAQRKKAQWDNAITVKARKANSSDANN